YAGMTHFLAYLSSRAQNGIVSYGLGDWVPYKTDTPAAVTSTGYYYVDSLILSRIARLLGRAADADRYARLADDIRAAFRRTFMRPDGSVANDSQTALSCAVYQGMATPEEIPEIVAKLAADVAGKGDHSDTGILGAKYLF